MSSDERIQATSADSLKVLYWLSMDVISGVKYVMHPGGGGYDLNVSLKTQTGTEVVTRVDEITIKKVCEDLGQD
jgi:hypothetical protein